eukprot:TRINITY_DN18282_c0_g2_i1.p1 TRINITY_DN18282_c0_g2~~TRINITY_DN18282_c0_g2_i1.p1  ORF type:complete len:397 (+),score=46.26 TRINITY_DN18282_c0_g2_i1:93-1283(+)
MTATGKTAETLALMFGVMVFGTLNNFLGRMKAEILGTYNFVTGITDNWVHLVINVTATLLLFRVGSITKDQLRYVFKCGSSWADFGIWKYIGIASISDVANSITGLASQPYLTALMMSMMDQATTPFTAICSFLMLGTRYSALETTCVVLLLLAAISGVLVAQASNDGENSPFWAAFAAVTTCFAAVSFVLKEMAFRDYAAHRTSSASHDNLYVKLAGQPVPEPVKESGATTALLPERLSIFLVSLIVSVGGVVTSLPVALINRWATSVGSPMQAVSEGFDCVLHCESSMEVYVVYTINNFVFNLCLLALTSRGSALLSFLSLKLVVPMTALCSSLPWPLIGAKTVSNAQWLILVIMLAALGGFRYGNIIRERFLVNGRKQGCCYPLCHSVDVQKV